MNYIMMSLVVLAIFAGSLHSTQAFTVVKPMQCVRMGTKGVSLSSTVSSGGVSGLKRVVVTGYGITSCLGNTIDDVKESLYECKSGITFSEEYAEVSEGGR